MKVTLLTLMFILGIKGYSQKYVEIYNTSSKTLSISMVATKPVTGDFPWCASVMPSVITVDPGANYILQNDVNIYRFPFYSPSSSTVITNWRRVLAPAIPGGNSNWSNMTSQTLWPLGVSQVFNYINFGMNGGSSGSGSVGETSFWATDYDSDSANQWEIFYIKDEITLTLIYYTIVVADM